MKRFRLALLSLLMVAAPVAAWAADEFDPQARAAAIAPYLTDDAIAVGHIDLEKTNVEAALKQAVEIVQPSEPQRSTILGSHNMVNDLIGKLKVAGATEIFAVGNLTLDIKRITYLIVPVKDGGNHRAVAGTMFGGNPEGPTSYEEADAQGYQGFRSNEVCTKLGDVVFCGRKALLDELKSNEPQTRPELTQAFTAAGDTAAQLVVVPTEANRRVIREMFPTLPPELGGASGETIARAFQWAAVGVNSPPDFSAELVIQSADEPAAESLAEAIKGAYEMLVSLPTVKKEFPMAEKLAELLTPQVQGDQLRLSVTKENQVADKLVSLLARPVTAAREQSRRNICRDNLKNLGIAMHNFHDVHGSFPPSASYDENGKKLLSWRVYLLPYLDANDLYKQFHLDEPWDSEHNKKLIEKMPEVFACPSADLAKKGMTTYLAPLGEKTSFSGKVGVPIQDITDGASNTIMFVDADPEHAVIWTKPEDLEIDLEKPLRGLVKQHEGGFQAVFCDGHIEFIAKSLDQRILGALFTRNGGEAVDR